MTMPSPNLTGDNIPRKGMILPFQPLTMTFHNVNYFVDMPKVCFLSVLFSFSKRELVCSSPGFCSRYYS